MFGIKGLLIGLAFTFVSTVAWTVVNDYTQMSGKIAVQKMEIKRLTSRLDGCNFRIERRNDAIEAVGGQCASKIKKYIKEGPPPKFDPFNANGGG